MSNETVHERFPAAFHAALTQWMPDLMEPLHDETHDDHEQARIKARILFAGWKMHGMATRGVIKIVEGDSEEASETAPSAFQRLTREIDKLGG